MAQEITTKLKISVERAKKIIEALRKTKKSSPETYEVKKSPETKKD